MMKGNAFNGLIIEEGHLSGDKEKGGSCSQPFYVDTFRLLSDGTQTKVSPIN
jgi:hypothetical protein